MVKPVAEGIKVQEQDQAIRCVPDLRGGKCLSTENFHNVDLIELVFKKEIAVINVGKLDKISGDTVNLVSLKEMGLIRPNAKQVKLLGSGEVSKPFTVDVDFISAAASKKIEAAGGSLK